MPDPFDEPGSLERQIAGALRLMIDERGPIDHPKVRAATRRIIKALVASEKDKQGRKEEYRALAERIKARMREGEVIEVGGRSDA